MLDNYKIGQPFVYNFVSSIVKNKKIAHAYLFDTKNLTDKMEFVIFFVKAILCEKYINSDNCSACEICRNIDSNICSDIKIIELDGLWIKKEQILELQKEMSTKSTELPYKIYIIKNCEFLNKQAANSLLKFLEEPEEGVIAILLTDNIHKVMNTIKSRCQVFTFKKENNNENESKFDREVSILNKSIENSNGLDIIDEKKIIEQVIEFIENIEIDKERSILFINTKLDNMVSNRVKLIFMFDIIFLFYKDVLNYKLFYKNFTFKNYGKEIEKIADLNDIMNIVRKLKLITKLQEKISNNINTNLLIDKLIIEMSEV